MSQKKILFVIDHLHGGGVEKIFYTLIKNLNPSLFKIDVIAIHDEGIYIDHIKKHATYNGIYKKSALNLEEATSLQNHYLYLNTLSDEAFSKHIITKTYDIEVSFSQGKAAKLVANSPNHDAKKVAWIHTNVIDNPWSDGAYKSYDEHRACYQKFNDIVCVSQGVKEAFIKKFNVDVPVHVLYNPIDSQDIQGKAQLPLDRRLASPTFKIVTVGRLVPVKGYDRLLAAHYQLIKEGFDYELWIIGDGDQRSSIENFIATNKLESWTKIMGYVENPYPYMAEADLLVCSSLAEGFSTVLAESLILGTPILSTKCAGTDELIGDNEYGVIVENNAQKLYEGIRRLLTSTTEYCKYHRLAKVRGDRFNLSFSIQAIERLLLGGKSQ